MRRIVVVCSRPFLSDQRQRRTPIECGRSAAPISRAAFEARLRRWYELTDDARVGDDSSFGGTPWVWIQNGARRFHLNADTTREGVGEYLAMLTREPELQWTVVRGRAGRLNWLSRDCTSTPGRLPRGANWFRAAKQLEWRERRLLPGRHCPTCARRADRPLGWSCCWSGGRSANVTTSSRCSAAEHGRGVPALRQATGAGCGR